MQYLKFKKATLAYEVCSRWSCRSFPSCISSTFILPHNSLKFLLLGPAANARPTFWKRLSHLRFATVTLLSFFDISIPALLAPKGLRHFRQVKEAHTHALLQAGLQVLPAAAAEYHGERVPAGKSQDVSRQGTERPHASFSCSCAWYPRAPSAWVAAVSLSEQRLERCKMRHLRLRPEVQSCRVPTPLMRKRFIQKEMSFGGFSNQQL